MTRPVRLSPYFTVAEVERSATAAARGIDNTVPLALWGNIARTAQLLECIRALVEEPLRITFLYRCPELNAAVGSSPTSAHLRGLAADFRPVSLPLEEAAARIVASRLPYDQLIVERTRDGAAWLHIGLSEGPPRREALLATGDRLGGPMTVTRTALG